MSVDQRSMSQSALTLCALASVKPVHVWPITLSCMIGFEKKMAQMSIMTK